jgi:hypothetical protein
MILNSLEARQIMEHLDTTFKKNVLEAALTDFDQSSSPLRLNYLAVSLRALCDMLIRDFATNAEVKACSWFRPSEAVMKDGKEIASRKQVIRYAIQAGLKTEFVQESLMVDVEGAVKQFGPMYGGLNKYTHFNEATFGLDEAEAEQFAENALETLWQIYESIEDCRQSVRCALESYAHTAVREVLTENVIAELDQLATHHNVEHVNLEDLSIEVMDAKMLRIVLSGAVDCYFQYGSSSDVERGDGFTTRSSYPYTCKYEADIAEPTELWLVENTMGVDTSSFYEGQPED